MRILIFLLPVCFIDPSAAAPSFESLIFSAYLKVAGGVLQRLYVVAFPIVRAGKTAVDRCLGVGEALGPHRVGRGLLQDRNCRRRTEVAAQAALFYH